MRQKVVWIDPNETFKHSQLTALETLISRNSKDTRKEHKTEVSPQSVSGKKNVQRETQAKIFGRGNECSIEEVMHACKRSHPQVFERMERREMRNHHRTLEYTQHQTPPPQPSMASRILNRYSFPSVEKADIQTDESKYGWPNETVQGLRDEKIRKYAPYKKGAEPVLYSDRSVEQLASNDTTKYDSRATVRRVLQKQTFESTYMMLRTNGGRFGSKKVNLIGDL